MLIKPLFSIALIFSAIAHADISNEQVTIESSQENLSTRTLILKDSLQIIGTAPQDIQTYLSSGQLTPAFIKTVSYYADNSSKAKFNALSDSERNELIRFCFLLKNKQMLSQQQVDRLLFSEKIRTGMNLQEVKKLNTLTNNLIQNPSYVLKEEDQNILKQIVPFLDQNPYPFVDFIGVAIEAGLPTRCTDPELGEILTKGSIEITGLSPEKTQQIAQITQNYQNDPAYDPSSEDIDTLNDITNVSVFPFGTSLLLPILGAEEVSCISEVTRAYPEYFYGPYVDGYNRDVLRNPRLIRVNEARRVAADRRIQERRARRR